MAEGVLHDVSFTAYHGKSWDLRALWAPAEQRQCVQSSGQILWMAVKFTWKVKKYRLKPNGSHRKEDRIPDRGQKRTGACAFAECEDKSDYVKYETVP